MTLAVSPEAVHTDEAPLLSSADADVRDFLAATQEARDALPHALAVIRDVCGQDTVPTLIVAHDSDGSQFDQLMVLIPVPGDINTALSQLSVLRHAWFVSPSAFGSRLSIDAELV